MKKGFLMLLMISLGVLFVLVFRKGLFTKNSEKGIRKHTVESVSNQIEKDVFQRLEGDLQRAGFDYFPSEIILLAFKEEQKLQIYAKKDGEVKFIKQYDFTASSGRLGPKMKEGDRQIPEGIYRIEYLNPNSSYHLSLKINYPNEFDKSKTNFKNIKEMGGDIFIHGKAVTIGCIPIGDEAIEEVFLMARKAFNNPIKVVISPRDFREAENYPNIESISWEKELYSQIEVELNKIPAPNL